MNSQAILYYVHDPMCSWCWGFRKVWDQLRAVLPSAVTVVNVVGGLAPDSNQPMPLEQRRTIAGYWSRVAEQTGAEFNFDFWHNCTPRRSTYPACRAVLAGANQQAEQPMIDTIQHAYYLRAMNPSDDRTLITLAGELGLDVQRFSIDLNSVETLATLQDNFALRRSINVRSFPSLVLAKRDIFTPIDINYHSHIPCLDAIKALL